MIGEPSDDEQDISIFKAKCAIRTSLQPMVCVDLSDRARNCSNVCSKFAYEDHAIIHFCPADACLRANESGHARWSIRQLRCQSRHRYPSIDGKHRERASTYAEV